MLKFTAANLATKNEIYLHQNSRELLTRLPALYWNLDSSIRLMLSLRDVTLNTTSRKINNEGVNN